MSNTGKEKTHVGKIFWQVLAAVILLPIAGALVTGTLSSWIDCSVESTKAAADSLWCKGNAAMQEGDRLSQLAYANPRERQVWFREANQQYRKAYGCGFPEAGLRLVLAHCAGLGETKNEREARRLIIEVESKHRVPAGRLNDFRKECGF